MSHSEDVESGSLGSREQQCLLLGYFFDTYFIFNHVHVCVRVYVWVYALYCRHIPYNIGYYLKHHISLELVTGSSKPAVWIREIKLRASARAIDTLNLWFYSPEPTSLVFFLKDGAEGHTGQYMSPWHPLTIVFCKVWLEKKIQIY